MVQAMAYTLLELEVPASRGGRISADCPREVYAALAWPEWTAGLPAEWTLFMPLNSRNVPFYDRAVAEEEAEAAAEAGGEGVGEEVGDDTQEEEGGRDRAGSVQIGSVDERTGEGDERDGSITRTRTTTMMGGSGLSLPSGSDDPGASLPMPVRLDLGRGGDDNSGGGGVPLLGLHSRRGNPRTAV